MGLSDTISEINGDFCRKPSFFSIPMYLMPLLNGFPLEFGTGKRDVKTRMMGHQMIEEVLR